MRMSVFPLSMLLLPEGKTKLRIFEPRYQRLVSLALKNGDGFVITPGQSHLSIGVHCYIEDFEQLDDGFLGITIVANKRVTLSSISQDDDGLIKAEMNPIEAWHWPKAKDLDALQPERLSELLSMHPIYAQPDLQELNSSAWCTSRWLELLPFSDEARVQVLNEANPAILSDLVIQLLDHLEYE